MNATGYGCALGDDTHKVNWLITRLRPAVTISLCEEDFPVGIIPVLASELGVDGGRLYDTIKRFTDREQAREAREAEQAASIPPQPPMTGDMAGEHPRTQADADQDEAQAAQLEADEHNEQVTR